MVISTKNIESIPTPTELLCVSQSIAMLDAILMPEWEYRYYSFDAYWGPNLKLASMQNGSGDHYHVLFTSIGTVITGHRHESTVARYNVADGKPWPGVLDSVPDDLMNFLKDPAFSIEETTFCLWRHEHESGWSTGKIDFPIEPNPDGSEYLLSILDGNPKTYQAWADIYYNRSVSLELVESLYSHQPITDELLSNHGLSVTVKGLEEEMDSMGYPK